MDLFTGGSAGSDLPIFVAARTPAPFYSTPRLEETQFQQEQRSTVDSRVLTTGKNGNGRSHVPVNTTMPFASTPLLRSPLLNDDDPALLMYTVDALDADLPPPKSLAVGLRSPLTAQSAATTTSAAGSLLHGLLAELESRSPKGKGGATPYATAGRGGGGGGGKKDSGSKPIKSDGNDDEDEEEEADDDGVGPSSLDLPSDTPQGQQNGGTQKPNSAVSSPLSASASALALFRNREGGAPAAARAAALGITLNVRYSAATGSPQTFNRSRGESFTSSGGAADVQKEGSAKEGGPTTALEVASPIIRSPSTTGGGRGGDAAFENDSKTKRTVRGSSASGLSGVSTPYRAEVPKSSLSYSMGSFSASTSPSQTPTTANAASPCANPTSLNPAGVAATGGIGGFYFGASSPPPLLQHPFYGVGKPPSVPYSQLGKINTSAFAARSPQQQQLVVGGSDNNNASNPNSFITAEGGGGNTCLLNKAIALSIGRSLRTNSSASSSSGSSSSAHHHQQQGNHSLIQIGLSGGGEGGGGSNSSNHTLCSCSGIVGEGAADASARHHPNTHRCHRHHGSRLHPSNININNNNSGSVTASSGNGAAPVQSSLFSSAATTSNGGGGGYYKYNVIKSPSPLVTLHGNMCPRQQQVQLQQQVHLSNRLSTLLPPLSSFASAGRCGGYYSRGSSPASPSGNVGVAPSGSGVQAGVGSSVCSSGGGFSDLILQQQQQRQEYTQQREGQVLSLSPSCRRLRNEKEGQPARSTLKREGEEETAYGTESQRHQSVRIALDDVTSSRSDLVNRALSFEKREEYKSNDAHAASVPQQLQEVEEREQHEQVQQQQQQQGLRLHSLSQSQSVPFGVVVGQSTAMRTPAPITPTTSFAGSEGPSPHLTVDDFTSKQPQTQAKKAAVAALLLDHGGKESQQFTSTSTRRSSLLLPHRKLSSCGGSAAACSPYSSSCVASTKSCGQSRAPTTANTIDASRSETTASDIHICIGVGHSSSLGHTHANSVAAAFSSPPASPTAAERDSPATNQLLSFEKDEERDENEEKEKDKDKRGRSFFHSESEAATMHNRLKKDYYSKATSDHMTSSSSTMVTLHCNLYRGEEKSKNNNNNTKCTTTYNNDSNGAIIDQNTFNKCNEIPQTSATTATSGNIHRSEEQNQNEELRESENVKNSLLLLPTQTPSITRTTEATEDPTTKDETKGRRSKSTTLPHLISAATQQSVVKQFGAKPYQQETPAGEINRKSHSQAATIRSPPLSYVCGEEKKVNKEKDSHHNRGGGGGNTNIQQRGRKLSSSLQNNMYCSTTHDYNDNNDKESDEAAGHLPFIFNEHTGARQPQQHLPPNLREEKREQRVDNNQKSPSFSSQKLSSDMQHQKEGKELLLARRRGISEEEDDDDDDDADLVADSSCTSHRSMSSSNSMRHCSDYCSHSSSSGGSSSSHNNYSTLSGLVDIGLEKKVNMNVAEATTMNDGPPLRASVGGRQQQQQTLLSTPLATSKSKRELSYLSCAASDDDNTTYGGIEVTTPTPAVAVSTEETTRSTVIGAPAAARNANNHSCYLLDPTNARSSSAAANVAVVNKNNDNNSQKTVSTLPFFKPFLAAGSEEYDPKKAMAIPQLTLASNAPANAVKSIEKVLGTTTITHTRDTNEGQEKIFGVVGRNEDTFAAAPLFTSSPIPTPQLTRSKPYTYTCGDAFDITNSDDGRGGGGLGARNYGGGGAIEQFALSMPFAPTSWTAADGHGHQTVRGVRGSPHPKHHLLIAASNAFEHDLSSPPLPIGNAYPHFCVHGRHHLGMSPMTPEQMKRSFPFPLRVSPLLPPSQTDVGAAAQFGMSTDEEMPRYTSPSQPPLAYTPSHVGRGTSPAAGPSVIVDPSLIETDEKYGPLHQHYVDYFSGTPTLRALEEDDDEEDAGVGTLTNNNALTCQEEEDNLHLIASEGAGDGEEGTTSMPTSTPTPMDAFSRHLEEAKGEREKDANTAAHHDQPHPQTITASIGEAKTTATILGCSAEEATVSGSPSVALSPTSCLFWTPEACLHMNTLDSAFNGEVGEYHNSGTKASCHGQHAAVDVPSNSKAMLPRPSTPPSQHDADDAGGEEASANVSIISTSNSNNKKTTKSESFIASAFNIAFRNGLCLAMPSLLLGGNGEESLEEDAEDFYGKRSPTNTIVEAQGGGGSTLSLSDGGTNSDNAQNCRPLLGGGYLNLINTEGEGAGSSLSPPSVARGGGPPHYLNSTPLSHPHFQALRQQLQQQHLHPTTRRTSSSNVKESGGSEGVDEEEEEELGGSGGGGEKEDMSSFPNFGGNGSTSIHRLHHQRIFQNAGCRGGGAENNNNNNCSGSISSFAVYASTAAPSPLTRSFSTAGGSNSPSSIGISQQLRRAFLKKNQTGGGNRGSSSFHGFLGNSNRRINVADNKNINDTDNNNTNNSEGGGGSTNSVVANRTSLRNRKGVGGANASAAQKRKEKGQRRGAAEEECGGDGEENCFEGSSSSRTTSGTTSSSVVGYHPSYVVAAGGGVVLPLPALPFSPPTMSHLHHDDKKRIGRGGFLTSLPSPISHSGDDEDDEEDGGKATTYMYTKKEGAKDAIAADNLQPTNDLQKEAEKECGKRLPLPPLLTTSPPLAGLTTEATTVVASPSTCTPIPAIDAVAHPPSTLQQPPYPSLEAEVLPILSLSPPDQRCADEGGREAAHLPANVTQNNSDIHVNSNPLLDWCYGGPPALPSSCCPPLLPDEEGLLVVKGENSNATLWCGCDECEQENYALWLHQSSAGSMGNCPCPCCADGCSCGNYMYSSFAEGHHSFLLHAGAQIPASKKTLRIIVPAPDDGETEFSYGKKPGCINAAEGKRKKKRNSLASSSLLVGGGGGREGDDGEEEEDSNHHVPNTSTTADIEQAQRSRSTNAALKLMAAVLDDEDEEALVDHDAYYYGEEATPDADTFVANANETTNIGVEIIRQRRSNNEHEPGFAYSLRSPLLSTDDNNMDGADTVTDTDSRHSGKSQGQPATLFSFPSLAVPAATTTGDVTFVGNGPNNCTEAVGTRAASRAYLPLEDLRSVNSFNNFEDMSSGHSTALLATIDDFKSDTSININMMNMGGTAANHQYNQQVMNRQHNGVLSLVVRTGKVQEEESVRSAFSLTATNTPLPSARGHNTNTTNAVRYAGEGMMSSVSSRTPDALSRAQATPTSSPQPNNGFSGPFPHPSSGWSPQKQGSQQRQHNTTTVGGGTNNNGAKIASTRPTHVLSAAPSYRSLCGVGFSVDSDGLLSPTHANLNLSSSCGAGGGGGSNSSHNALALLSSNNTSSTKAVGQAVGHLSTSYPTSNNNQNMASVSRGLGVNVQGASPNNSGSVPPNQQQQTPRVSLPTNVLPSTVPLALRTTSSAIRKSITTSNGSQTVFTTPGLTTASVINNTTTTTTSNNDNETSCNYTIPSIAGTPRACLAAVALRSDSQESSARGMGQKGAVAPSAPTPSSSSPTAMSTARGLGQLHPAWGFSNNSVPMTHEHTTNGYSARAPSTSAIPPALCLSPDAPFSGNGLLLTTAERIPTAKQHEERSPSAATRCPEETKLSTVLSPGGSSGNSVNSRSQLSGGAGLLSPLPERVSHAHGHAAHQPTTSSPSPSKPHPLNCLQLNSTGGSSLLSSPNITASGMPRHSGSIISHRRTVMIHNESLPPLHSATKQHHQHTLGLDPINSSQTRQPFTSTTPRSAVPSPSPEGASITHHNNSSSHQLPKFETAPNDRSIDEERLCSSKTEKRSEQCSLKYPARKASRSTDRHSCESADDLRAALGIAPSPPSPCGSNLHSPSCETSPQLLFVSPSKPRPTTNSISNSTDDENSTEQQIASTPRSRVSLTTCNSRVVASTQSLLASRSKQPANEDESVENSNGDSDVLVIRIKKVEMQQDGLHRKEDNKRREQFGYCPHLAAGKTLSERDKKRPPPISLPSPPPPDPKPFNPFDSPTQFAALALDEEIHMFKL